jgi:hypothetical protein
VLDDADLVADLGAAEDGDERLLRMTERFAQILEFFFHQQAGGVLFHEMGDALGGGMGTVSGSESVVHVIVAELGEVAGELGIVGFFFGVEAEIF